MAIKVGTFLKTTTAAPVQQEVTGVGFKADALLLWTVYATAYDAYQSNIIMAAGMGTKGQRYSFGATAGDNLNPTQTGEIAYYNIMAIMDWAGTAQAIGNLVNCDDDGFTLEWTTNNATAIAIHYMAIGGEYIEDVQLTHWSKAAAAGNYSVTGVGFQPDLVVHMAGHISLPGKGISEGALSIGAMDASGGQYSWGYCSDDNVTPANVYLAQGEAALVIYHSGLGLGYQLDFMSMDPDGFTVNDSLGGWATDVTSLCLKGGNYKVGMANELGYAGNQSITGVGFEPEGVLFLGACGINDLSPAHMAACVGAYDGSDQWTGLFYDRDGPAASATDVYASTMRCMVSAISFPPAGPDAVVTPVSLDADGFTVHWSADVFGNGLLNSLIAYWPGNEAAGNLLDAHVNALHMTDGNTVTNNPGLVYATARQYTAANNEYHFRAGDDALLSAGDNNFTIASWVYLNTKTDSRTIFSKFQAPGTFEYYLIYYITWDRYIFMVRNITDTANVSVRAETFGSPPLNTWTCVIGWHDALNNTINIQINNGPVDSAAIIGGVFDGTSAAQIGVANGAAYWNGRIGPTAFWKNVPFGGGVLNSAQRGAWYGGGAGITYANLTT